MSMNSPSATNDASGRGFVARERLVVLTMIVTLFIFGAVLSATHKDVSQGFDEVAQSSYVAEMQRGGAVWPNLNALHLLDPRTFRFTERANYLNHPPLYYLVLARLGPRLEGHPQALLFFRLVNVLLAAIGLAASLAIGFYARFGRLQLYAYAVPLLCIPVLAPLAGAINNDNAAFCGGAIALFGLSRLLTTERQLWLYTALAGAIIAGWAKLTGLILTETIVTVVVLYMIWRKQFRQEWIAPTIVAIVLAVLPYAIFVAQYGSPAPDTAAQEALLRTGSHIAGWASAPRLSPPAYAGQFAVRFVAEWMPTLMPRSPFQYAMLSIPVTALMCAALGVWMPAHRLARREEQPLDVIILAGVLALAVTFACHIIFSYQRHLATGWMMDAYPRYYLPLAAIVPLCGLSAASTLRKPRLRATLLVFLIVGPILFRFFGAPLSF